MGQPAAKEGDFIQALDTHIILIPPAMAPTPLPHNFMGQIDGELSLDVCIEGKPAATADSTASNNPPHIPQGGNFQSPPADKGTIKMGSATVAINGKQAARNGDMAETCNDPSDMPVGTVIAVGTVMVG